MTTVWVIAASIIVPAVLFGIGYEVGRVHAEYARRRFVHSLLGDDAHFDFVEPDVYGLDPDGPWGDSQRGGYHSAAMRRDRVRRHPEAPSTFPAGDVA